MLQRQHRVSCQAGKKSPGSFPLKATFNQAARGLDTEQTESCQFHWMSWHTDGPQEIDLQAIPRRDQRRPQLQTRSLIREGSRRGRLDRPGLGHCRSVIEWMCNRSGRLDPFETMLSQRKRTKKRRTDSERIDRGADIMNKAR